MRPRLFAMALAGVGCYQWRLWRGDRELARRQRLDREVQSLPPQTPRVSALVAAWNEGPRIEGLLRSFMALDYPEIELILCAGGDDDTLVRARRFEGERVTVLEQRQGEGKQRALARCLERASGEILYLTDADCLFDATALRRTILPLAVGATEASTGGSRPLPAQRSNPLVACSWAIQAYGWERTGEYSFGLLGRNCAASRAALERAGGFDGEVAVGTDYHLARRLLRMGTLIRAVRGSEVETRYPESASAYVRQQSRWLRNLFLHGLSTGDRYHVRHAVVTMGVGVAGLLLPLLGSLGSGSARAAFLLLAAHSWLSRARYLGSAQLSSRPVPAITWLLIPALTVLDWLAWARTLFDLLLPSRRYRW